MRTRCRVGSVRKSVEPMSHRKHAMLAVCGLALAVQCRAAREHTDARPVCVRGRWGSLGCICPSLRGGAPDKVSCYALDTHTRTAPAHNLRPTSLAAAGTHCRRRYRALQERDGGACCPAPGSWISRCRVRSHLCQGVCSQTLMTLAKSWVSQSCRYVRKTTQSC